MNIPRLRHSSCQDLTKTLPPLIANIRVWTSVKVLGIEAQKCFGDWAYQRLAIARRLGVSSIWLTIC